MKSFYLTNRKAFLFLLSKVYLPERKRRIPPRIDEILIFAPPRIGDAALALPVFNVLRNAFPQYRLHVVANIYVSEMLSLVKEIDEIIPFPQSFRAQLQALRNLFSDPKYDIALDLNFDYPVAPAILAGCSARFSIGYEYAGRGVFLSKSLSPPDSAEHASHIFFKPVHELQPSAQWTRPHLDVPQDLAMDIHRILSQAGIDVKDRVILMHPGAHHPTQRWLPEYFSETAERILNASLAKVIFIGGKDDTELIERIRTKMATPPDGVFTELNLKRLIALIQRAQLMICNNSGPLHLAAALNTPTVSTMGPTVMERWKPLGTIHQVLRMDNLPCIGCNIGYCKIGTLDCMRLITPSMMINGVVKVMAKPAEG